MLRLADLFSGTRYHMHTCALLVLLLGALVSSQNFPVVAVDSGSQTLSAGSPASSSSAFSANLQASLSVSLTHGSVPVVLCLQRLVPAPAYQQLSAATCTHFLRFDANTTTADLAALTAEPHYWTVYFDAAVASPSPLPIRLLLNGSTCPDGNVFNGATCTLPQATLALNGSAALSLAPSVAWFAAIDVPAQIGRLALSVVDANNATVTSVQLLARLAGSPSIATADAAGAGALSVDAPRPGRWYLAASSTSAVSATLRVSVDDCRSREQQGPGCALNVTKASAAAATIVTLAAGESAYFVLNASEHSAQLFASVYAPTADVQPRISATRGQLALQAQGADIGGCNRPSCAVPAIVTSNVSDLWYVTVTAVNASEGVGIWFDSLCVPGCDTHGTCNSEGLDGLLGVCECVSDYEGVDCMTPSGAMLGAQYIVLIIIASLVVASALIGFIAWAYMRRKRAQYDKVG